MHGHRIIFVAMCAAVLSSACSSESNTVGGDKYLGLEEPRDGFQIRSIGADVPSGADVEYCEVAQLPGDPSDTYYVKSLEFGNGVDSHHLIVTAALPGGLAEQKLQALGIGHRVECLSSGSAFGEVGFEGVGGSQQPYAALTFPEGVGREYHGGQFIVFDYHYFNTTPHTVQARSAVNFHLIDASQVEHLARGFSFANLTIDTPAGQSGSFKGACHFDMDVNVGGLSRHTHRWGKDYSVWFSGGARDAERFWTSTDWEHDVSYEFEEPVLVQAGEGFGFQCDYQNDTDHALRFGTSASDEMCILFGVMWAAHDGETLRSQNCDITWVDSTGVGHPADEAGGFPKPTPEQVSACLDGYGAAIDACAECQCNACAAPIINCAIDPECRTVLACFGSCADADCVAGCQKVLDEHSSALGPLAQMTGCVDHACPMCDDGSGG